MKPELDTNQLIRERFLSLPDDIKNVIRSVDLTKKLKEVGNKNNLLLDQIGALEGEVMFILLGLEPSSDFVVNISKMLNIDRKKAFAIGQDLNKEIFDSIKDQLRVIEPVEEVNVSTRADPISSLERVGGFSIDKPATEPERKPVTPADRNSILAGLENPPTSAPTPTDQVPANLPTSSTNSSNPVPRTLPAQPKQEESHVEPLVDYLLSNPVGQASKTISPTRPTPAQQPKPRPAGTPDPYRESF